MARKLGPDHRITLYVRHGLADAYSKAGRVSQAIARFEANRGEMDVKLGRTDGHTLACLSGLAAAYEKVGRQSDAERLYVEVLARRRKTVPADSPLLAADLAALGRHLLGQSRWSEAEPPLREALAIREKATFDDWGRYDAMSLLGGALLGQGRDAEAEPLLVAGYEGMKTREARITVPDRSRLGEAAERVIRLYEVANRPEKAAEWKARAGMPDLPGDVFARP